MAGESSSRKRPMKRAGTRSRSITSSTTGRHKRRGEDRQVERTSDVTSDFSDSTETWTEPFLLTVAQQKEFARLLSQGASPAAACSVLEVAADCALLSFDSDARFRRKLEHVYQSLTDNVRAALYREAMKGKVTAQIFWLKDEASQRSAQQSAPPASRAALQAELERVMAVLRSDGAEGGLS